MGLPLPLGAGLISAAGSLLGNLFGFGSQAATNKAQMELAKYQYEKNLEMWNRQNEYNLPSAQRQRLLDAGLNPALMYGSGHISNTAADAPSYDAPHLSAYTNFGDFGASGAINAYLSSSKTNAEVDNIEEDTLLKRVNEDLIMVQRNNVLTQIAEAQLRIARTYVEKKYWEEQAEYGMKLTKESYENLLKDSNLKDFQIFKTASEAREADINADTAEQLQPILVENEKKRGVLLDNQAFAAAAAGKASIASANASNASAQTSLALAGKYHAETRKIVSELSFLTYRQQEQLDAYVNQKISESVLAGEKVNSQVLENWITKHLIEGGNNPKADGSIHGQVERAVYKWQQAFKRWFGKE